ncbi:MAG TPA: hypothetical protein VMA77_20295 [Solirubrobacteraceae bacterium]|nr:hypothetical protein [Solirubrobacteraceae bacterium]
MSREISDATLDQRLRSVDPLDPGALPSEADTEAALRRLLAAGRPPAPTRRLGAPRVRLLAGATASIAALAAGLVVLLGSSATSPAFAVTRNPNGTITVRLITLSGIAGANHRLVSMGVRARILSLVYEAHYVASVHPCQGLPSGAVRTLTFDPAKIPRRQLLLLAPVREGQVFYFSRVRARNAGAAERSLIAHARALAAARGSVANRLSGPKIDHAHTVKIYCPSTAGSPPR